MLFLWAANLLKLMLIYWVNPSWMIQSLLYPSAWPNRGKIKQNEDLTPIPPLFFFLSLFPYFHSETVWWMATLHLERQVLYLKLSPFVQHDSWNWSVCLNPFFFRLWRTTLWCWYWFWAEAPIWKMYPWMWHSELVELVCSAVWDQMRKWILEWNHYYSHRCRKVDIQ